MAADQVELESGRLAGVHEVRATGDVDDGLHERLVERHERVAVAGDARLVAEGLPDGLPEHDADVLDRVVHVDLGVARGRTVRSISECFAKAVSRWSKNGTVVEMSTLPGAVEVERRGRCWTRSSSRAMAVRGAWAAHDGRDLASASALEERGRLGLACRPSPAAWPGCRHRGSRMPRSSSASNVGVRVVDAAEQHEVASLGRTARSRARGARATMRSRCAPISSTMREHLGAWRERGDRGRLGERRQVVRQAHEAERVDDRRVRGEVADAGAGERERLAHGARDEQALAPGQQASARSACPSGANSA